MNRRYFLKNVSVVAGGLVLAGKRSWAMIAKNKRRFGGVVLSNGKPLADVIVSDGYSVVKTDKQGRFGFSGHKDAKAVFVSTPSGYAFTHKDNIAGCYQAVNIDDETADCRFELNRLDRDDNQHAFIIWADPQVKNDKDVEKMMKQSVPDTKQTLASFPAGTLLHGITVGDIVWDNHELFPAYNKAVADMGIPFFQALGNHDMDYRLGGDETSDITFKTYYGPTYYSFNRGRVHYIVLDDVRYLGREREYDGYISEAQLDWLKKDLSFVPKDSLIIVNLHIPVHNGVKNNDELYKILRPFKKAHIMSGHTHYQRNVIKEGVFEHNHGAVCGAWWTGPICEDGAPRGYGVYEVNGTDMKWYYKACDHEKDYQVTLNVETLTDQKRLLANVWNWDPEWKVEWWADGQPMGTLEATKGYDPQAVELYKGPELPKSRGFAEPHLTEHIFMAHFKPGVKQIKVTATDRFGKSYTSTLTS